jgi:hypothetical protein
MERGVAVVAFFTRTRTPQPPLSGGIFFSLPDEGGPCHGQMSAREYGFVRFSAFGRRLAGSMWGIEASVAGRGAELSNHDEEAVLFRGVRQGIEGEPDLIT